MRELRSYCSRGCKELVILQRFSCIKQLFLTRYVYVNDGAFMHLMGMERLWLLDLLLISRVYFLSCLKFLGLNITPRSFISGHVVWSEKCGLGKNLKSETIFSPSRFRLAKRNSLNISGRGTAKEKHFKLLAFDLMLIDQVKRPVWIQTDIYRARSFAATFKLRLYCLWQILITQNIQVSITCNRSA